MAPHGATRYEHDGPQRFRGGARVRGMHATWPLASLAFDRAHARIGVLGRLRGPIWIEREEVREVAVRSEGLGSSIWFATESGDHDDISFRTFDPERVVRAFAAAGWPVGEGFRLPPPIAG